MDVPSEEMLRKLSYSQLRKYARKSGIKGNRKADFLIASILEKNSIEEELGLNENKIVNSTTKNKQEKFDVDKLMASATPRRETYTVDTPLDASVRNNEMVGESASPVLRKSPDLNESSFNVTVTRGSEKKSKSRKVSFVTPARKSERLSLTPRYASVKNRPKTPIPSRISSGIKKFSFSNTPSKNGKKSSRVGLDKISGGGKERRPSTPMPLSKSKTRKQSSSGSLEPLPASPSIVPIWNMESPLPLVKEVDSEIMTPKSEVRTSKMAPVSSSVRKTPNFKKIHEKGFNKMESLDDYSTRQSTKKEKILKEQKKFHIPGEEKKSVGKKNVKARKPFGGIPFIPSIKEMKGSFTSGFQVISTPGTKVASFLKTDSSLHKTRAAGNIKALKTISRENTPLKKNTFDLKASLSKKLPYKPHKGPLKPLKENMNTSIIQSATSQVQKENRVVKSNRIESRSVLKGVRTNRRFELQMKNRKCSST